MKTTLWNAVSAYRAAKQLERCRLDSFSAALRVAQLCQALSGCAKTLVQEEEKLLKQYGARRVQGTWRMEDPEKQEAVCKELDALHNTEMEIDWTPVHVVIQQADGISISARDASALSAFIEVEDGTA